MVDVDRRSFGKGRGFAVVGEGKQVHPEFDLTLNTPARMVATIALILVMSEVERLWLAVNRAQMMGQVVGRVRRVLSDVRK